MPIVLVRQKIDAALPKVAPGLAKYLKIMEFVATDPAFHDDPEFRWAFNGFYRVRRSAQTWQPHYFALMARAKSNGFDFSQTLEELSSLPAGSKRPSPASSTRRSIRTRPSSTLSSWRTWA